MRLNWKSSQWGRFITTLTLGIVSAMVFSQIYGPVLKPRKSEIVETDAVSPGIGETTCDSDDHPDEACLVASIPDAMCSCCEVQVLWPDDPPIANSSVIDVQEGLAAAGYYSGPQDGVFGDATVSAVTHFQEDVGLITDGVVDMAVWMALAKMCEPIVASNLRPSGDILPDQADSEAPMPDDVYKKDESPAAEAPPESDSTAASKKAEKSSQPSTGWRAILIDCSNLTLTLVEDGRPIRQYRVGIGKPATPTPLGQFKIIGKAAWAGGFGTRWMGLNVPWGKYGIHGTNKPWTVGARKSGGCIRMLNRDVEELYSMVPVGAPVLITAGSFGVLGTARPRIEPGAKGSYVYEVQKRLIRLGYLKGNPDGVYGKSTEQATMKLQKDCGLPVTGIIDMMTYKALGMILFE